MRIMLQELIGGFTVANTVTTQIADVTTITSTGIDLEYIVIGIAFLITLRFVFEFLIVFTRHMMTKGGK